ncbi:MAG: hypothetical protein IPG79_20950 [Saprospiraceae bacterium]|nr:hypothetical protein [Saprospiraceae bacterium]
MAKIWPSFMKAVIEACKNIRLNLYFLDNGYMYDTSAIPHMTENSPIHAPSKKGVARQQLHEMIMQEVEKTLTALIARSADFYGPDNKSSALNMMVVDNFSERKKSTGIWQYPQIHAYTLPRCSESNSDTRKLQTMLLIRYGMFRRQKKN